MKSACLLPVSVQARLSSNQTQSGHMPEQPSDIAALMSQLQQRPANRRHSKRSLIRRRKSILTWRSRVGEDIHRSPLMMWRISKQKISMYRYSSSGQGGLL
ncbi:hypothetical protein OK016_28070 [Vibrio chagasii]|nr:hypothetical protein [Vibrio chagasii]